MIGRARAVGRLLPALALVVMVRAAPAQEGARPRPRLVVRADGIVARASAVHAALGVSVPFGNYLRVDAVAGGGTEWSGGARRGSARGDLVARFVLDPFRQSRWASYGGAGLSALRTEGRWGGYVLAVAGLEGPAAGAFLPALELGLGRGSVSASSCGVPRAGVVRQARLASVRRSSGARPLMRSP